MRVDEIALREFLLTAYPRLVAAVALVCGSRPAAEDAVQEALLRAWEQSEKGEEIESLNAWVTTVAMNLARSGLRRLRSERRARARLHGPLSSESASSERIDVERALSTIPRRQREAVVLRYYLQMDTREVADALGINEGTVKSTLFRARTALASALGVHEDEEANDRGA
ncbi:MAG TPA: sigma-70 family RNA polymerase sigma factor [Actinomycetota bacterium]|jgi:RNA polymerase sigma factor (sigma-70 family)|nr:sigma-70 family RNA polymerase sigma factor [Actinomycetota bacterium]HEX5904163.1 sigma-70 family RNA polymerase sigma factor [Actinomycetota bacterium]